MPEKSPDAWLNTPNLRMIRAGNYAGPDRRERAHITETQFSDLVERIVTHDEMRAMRSDLAANSEKTAEIYDLLTAAKGAFRFLSGLGAVIAWAGKIAAGAAALYGLWYGLTHPGGK